MSKETEDFVSVDAAVKAVDLFEKRNANNYNNMQAQLGQLLSGFVTGTRVITDMLREDLGGVMPPEAKPIADQILAQEAAIKEREEEQAATADKLIAEAQQEEADTEAPEAVADSE